MKRGIFIFSTELWSFVMNRVFDESIAPVTDPQQTATPVRRSEPTNNEDQRRIRPITDPAISTTYRGHY
jgi:hypothetical protein